MRRNPLLLDELFGWRRSFSSKGVKATNGTGSFRAAESSHRRRHENKESTEFLVS